jgi:biopolymer transport protein ExbD
VIRALAGALLLWGLPYRPAAPPADDFTARLAAIDRCRQGYAAFATAPPPRAPDLARACADIYREPACAAAMRNPGADPSARPSTIARACRDAYCPRLAAPRPRLCDAADLPLPSQLLSQWAELQQQIMALELEVDPKVLAPLFKPIVVSVKEVPPVAPARRAQIVVEIRPAADGRVHIAVENLGGITVSNSAAIGDAAVASLAHNAVAPLPSGVDREVILRAEKSVLFTVMQTVIAAFQKEGVTHVAVTTAMPPAK